MVDQHFGKLGKIDILLGVDVFVASLLPGKRVGAPNTQVGIETMFGWVLTGKTNSLTSPTNIATHHSSLLSVMTCYDYLGPQKRLPTLRQPTLLRNSLSFNTSRRITSAQMVEDSRSHYLVSLIPKWLENQDLKRSGGSCPQNIHCTQRINLGNSMLSYKSNLTRSMHSSFPQLI